MHVEHAVGAERAGQTVYVYEWPVRLWHWINALCVAVLAGTGYMIGAVVLPTPAGEASEHFWFGYLRFTHFTAAQLLAVGWLARIYWAFAGNRHAHQIFFVPLRDARFWREVGAQLRWYALRAPMPQRYLGHNPLAQVAIFCGFVLPLCFMLLSGFALYSEGQGVGSAWDRVFGWLLPLLGGGQAVHTWHRLGMWILLCFSIVHVYMVVREDLMSRQTIIDAMVTGYRTFRR